MNSDLSAPRRPIQRLPNDLINQIAAGEVVERPASVIKELVENSLDAGATRIDILLTEGGMEAITILDNGHGIPETELALAMERHATSKLRRFADLESLGSFGFRGEALASIASVAEMQIASRTPDMPRCATLTVAYAEPTGPLQFIAGPIGTRVTVTRLFDRLPARLKFLRTPGTEFSHSARVVREIALGNPEIAFFLHHQGKLVHSYPPGDRFSRLKDCMKPAWQPLHIDEEASGMRAEALLSPPDLLSDRGELFLFVNGRPVRQKTLISAVRNAYLQTLGPHHEPSGVLYLDLRREWVDVNVHPQKWEVRIQRQEAVYAWLLARVKRELQALAPPPLPPWEMSATAAPARNHDSPLPLSAPSPRPTRWVGALQDLYWLYETGEGLVIVDRRRLQRYLNHRHLQEKGSQPQALRLPPVKRIGRELVEATRKHLVHLEAIGFRLEAFDDGDVTFQAIPDILTENASEPCLRDCLRLLTSSPSPSARDLLSVLAQHGEDHILKTLSPTTFDPSSFGPDSDTVCFRITWDDLNRKRESPT